MRAGRNAVKFAQQIARQKLVSLQTNGTATDNSRIRRSVESAVQAALGKRLTRSLKKKYVRSY